MIESCRICHDDMVTSVQIVSFHFLNHEQREALTATKKPQNKAKDDTLKLVHPALSCYPYTSPPARCHTSRTAALQLSCSCGARRRTASLAVARQTASSSPAMQIAAHHTCMQIAAHPHIHDCMAQHNILRSKWLPPSLTGILPTSAS